MEPEEQNRKLGKREFTSAASPGCGASSLVAGSTQLRNLKAFKASMMGHGAKEFMEAELENLSVEP